MSEEPKPKFSLSAIIAVIGIVLTLSGGIITVWMNSVSQIAAMQIQVQDLKEDVKTLQAKVDDLQKQEYEYHKSNN